MSPSERRELRAHLKKTRANELNCIRQENFRKRQRDAGLENLQVRLSCFSHAKAKRITQTDTVSLSQLYEFAILAVDPQNPPAKHEEVLEGDLIGSCQISPWMSVEAVEKFENLARTYHTRTVAMSAIVNAYCDNVLADADYE